MSELKTTPLRERHIAAGAKMVPFAGWEMPVQYEGILAEHAHTRENASLFDICHMGEFVLAGPGAREALGKVVSHNLDTLGVSKCRYGFLLNEQGCVLDDLIVYRLAEEEFMLVVNGATTQSDFDWISAHLPQGLMFTDISEATAKIDLQGPKAYEVAREVLEGDFASLKFFNFMNITFEGASVIASRTGYTGELGYEFYAPAPKAVALWDALLADERVKPAGLGARDTIRLEMGYPLYGHDLDTEHTPAEAGYEMLLTSPAEYVGKGKDREVARRLTALAIEGRRSAREHDVVLLPSGEEVGTVTSGSFAPSLGHAIALAYIKAEVADRTDFEIKGKKKNLIATRTDLPFYRQGTARMKVE